MNTKQKPELLKRFWFFVCQKQKGKQMQEGWYQDKCRLSFIIYG